MGRRTWRGLLGRVQRQLPGAWKPRNSIHGLRMSKHYAAGESKETFCAFVRIAPPAILRFSLCFLAPPMQENDPAAPDYIPPTNPSDTQLKLFSTSWLPPRPGPGPFSVSEQKLLQELHNRAQKRMRKHKSASKKREKQSRNRRAKRSAHAADKKVGAEDGVALVAS
eukprot:SAG31_NODE_8216_length_1494_cov_2.132616_2_plen_167_part_00